jgi:hypothetical protein
MCGVPAATCPCQFSEICKTCHSNPCVCPKPPAGGDKPVEGKICPTCKGGIGDHCAVNQQCASGLSCDHTGVCVCATPNAPLGLTVTQLPTGDFTASIKIAWIGSSNTDSYVVILDGPTPKSSWYYIGTDITFSGLQPGAYLIKVFAVSTKCGVGDAAELETILYILCQNEESCQPGLGCPEGQLCKDGKCITPCCFVDSDCRQGDHCVDNDCVPGCSDELNCPGDAQICSDAGTCVQCETRFDCLPDSDCVQGECSCKEPAVTAVVATNVKRDPPLGWPLPLNFQFTVSNAATIIGSFPLFNFKWTAYGATGVAAYAGIVTDYFSPTNTFVLNLTGATDNCPQQGQPCCPNASFGCSSSNCTNSDVLFVFSDLTVTNGCGKTSAPTCWQARSLCPGSTTSGFEQINCVADVI